MPRFIFNAEIDYPDVPGGMDEHELYLTLLEQLEDIARLHVTLATLRYVDESPDPEVER